MDIKKFMVVLVIAIILLYAISSGMLSIWGYITGFQGLSPEFSAIYWKNYVYSASDWGPNPNYRGGMRASACSFYDHINFDPDEETDYLPNLHASMQPVTVDKEVEPKRYGPWRIKVGSTSETITNSSGTFTINYDVYKEFEMLRFKCDWRVNIWLDGSYAEYYPDEKRHYYDLEIWMKVVPQNFVYFVDNPDQVYFAPAYIGLDENAFWGYYDPGSRELKSDPNMGSYQDIFPEAQGETLAIFYNFLGAGDTMSEQKLLSYQGALLDPNIFRTEYWIRFSIHHFYPVSWFGTLGDWYCHFPSVNLKFLIYVFVVGQWTVRLQTGEVKELLPHQTQWSETTWDRIRNWFAGIGAWFTNPWTLLWTGIIGFFAILIVLVILAVFAPGFLAALGALFKRLFKREG